VVSAYSKIAAGDNVNIEYKCSGDLKQREASEIEAEILLALPELRRAEIERGLSLIGPHRDDLLLTLGATPVRGYASQGESWSFALSLRVATYHLFRSDGDLPILILDDVFAELDAARRKALVELIKDGEQVIVTAAVEEDLPQDLLHRKIYVRSGTLNE
jgi:DNA replication and repair protein RecF